MTNPYDPPGVFSRDPCEASDNRHWPHRLTASILLFPLLVVLTLPVLQISNSTSHHDRHFVAFEALVTIVPFGIAVPTVAISTLRFRGSSRVAKAVAMLVLVVFLSFVVWSYSMWGYDW